jgi:hypothetical protein
MYKVLVASLTELTTRDDINDALNVAATHMRSSPNAVALVMDGENTEAVTVMHNNWAYLAKDQETE